MTPLHLLTDELAALKAGHLHRTPPALGPRQGPHIDLDGKPYLNFSSNDYLGLAAHPQMAQAAAAAAHEQGTGAGASRLIAGSLPVHRQLEADLARLLDYPAALLFNTGFQANLGLITALAGPDDVILSDALNHASIIDACRLSRAAVHVYPHGDAAEADRLLRRLGHHRRRLLVTESLFSMDGDLAPLTELRSVATERDAALLLDEAHAFGVLGPSGHGLAAATGVRPAALLATFGKALGSFGAFVAADTEVIDYLTNRSRSFIFTTALPPPVVAASLSALHLAGSAEGDLRRLHLQALIAQVHAGLLELGLPCPADSTPIVPVVVGEPDRALALSQRLRECGLFVHPIRPPTVPPGTSRLRIALSAGHSPDDVARLLAALRAHRDLLTGHRSTSTPTRRPLPEPTPPSSTGPDLIELDRRHLWHPFTPMRAWLDDPDPLVIDRAEGHWLHDAKGRRFLDGVSSLWCNVHGHQVPELDAALRDQLGRVAHSTLLGLSQTEAIRLASELVAVAPTGLSRVFYSDSGSTAVEVALKLAYQVQQLRGNTARTRFAALGQAYHGDTIGAVSVGGIDLFHRTFHPLLFAAERVPPPYCYRCPWGLTRPACALHCADQVVALIEREAPSLAAFVVEPLVQGAAGMLTQPPGYLRPIAEACRRHDVLLIVDEVATGFGRTGTLFACEQEAVRPDILTVAKGLTGGYLPLAATLTTEAIFESFLGAPDEFRTFFHGHTYTGNALACAVARASLALLQQPDFLPALQARTALLSHLLDEQLAPLPAVGEIRQRGLMVGIELVANRTTRAAFPAAERRGALACRLARERGVYLRPLSDVVVLMPALSMSDDELGLLVAAAAHGIRLACPDAKMG